MKSGRGRKLRAWQFAKIANRTDDALAIFDDKLCKLLKSFFGFFSGHLGWIHSSILQRNVESSFDEAFFDSIVHGLFIVKWWAQQVSNL